MPSSLIIFKTPGRYQRHRHAIELSDDRRPSRDITLRSLRDIDPHRGTILVDHHVSDGAEAAQQLVQALAKYLAEPWRVLV